MKKRHTDLALEYVEIVPAGHDRQASPVVVLIHGRGADANDLSDLAQHLDNGDYRFIFPNAPKPFEIFRGYSQGFTWFDGWPPERGSFGQSREKLLTFLGEVSQRYGTPFSKMVIGGFSQGGMMSIDAGYRLPEPPAGIVVMSGATYEDELPAINRDVPILIAHGTEDDVIPARAAQRTRAILEQHGANAEYYEFAMGHWIVPEEIEKVKAFLARVLASAPAR